MNLNKTLCKYFDLRSRGYVTLGDFIASSLMYCVVIFIIYLSLYSSYIFLSKGAYWAEQPNDIYNFYTLGGTIITVLLITILMSTACIIYVIIKKILSIKIAECKLKDDGKQ